MGLTNGVIGVVKHIIFPKNSDPRNHPGGDKRKENLPLVVLVHFPSYEGPTEWFDDDGSKLVPIVPSTVRWNGGLSRTQLPLRLAYAISVHKSQGATLDKAYVHLGPKEFSKGLTFVACSRVRNLHDLVFDDFLSLARIIGANGRDPALEKDRIRREALGFEEETYGVQLEYTFDEDNVA